MTYEDEVARTERIEATAMAFYREDVLLRQMADASVNAAFRKVTRDQIEDNPERAVHEVATEAVAFLLARMYYDDVRFGDLIRERDHYKKVAEQSLSYTSSHLAFFPAP